MKKDKEKVLDEVWTEERIRGFLTLEPAAGTSADFHRLHKAYQSMKPDDFSTFVGLFVSGDHDINATDPGGRTVLSYAREHRSSGDYVAALESNGAV